MIRFPLLFLCLQYSLLGISQSITFQKVAKLSQRTNVYITQSSEKKVYISSTDGLNITNGHGTKIYKSGLYNLIGNNIQSAFFEDSLKNVYFTTFECLHKYDRCLDKISPLFITGESGEVLKTDFTILGQQENILFVRTSENITLFNTLDQTVYKRVPIDISDYQIASIYFSKSDTQVIAANHEGLVNYTFKESNNPQVLLRDIEISCIHTSTYPVLWIGTIGGDQIAYHIEKKEMLYTRNISNQGIKKIERTAKHLMITLFDRVIFYDPANDIVVKEIFPRAANTQKPIGELLISYLDPDSILWISSAGKGVFFGSIRPPKFDLWLQDQEFQDKNNITGILEKNNTYYFLTRDGGINAVNKIGLPAANHVKLQKTTSHAPIITGIFYDNNHILFSNYYSLNLINIHTGKVKQLAERSTVHPQYYFQIKYDPDHRILCSTLSHGLMEIKINSGHYDLHPIGDTLLSANDLTYFEFDSQGRLYLSKNETEILIGNKINDDYQVIQHLPISGGIYSLYDVNDSLIYITNTQGIFAINPLSNFAVTRILDSKQVLAQHIYCALPDTLQNLWITSNEGMFLYNLWSKKLHQFSLNDGLQDHEYNTHAYLISNREMYIVGGTYGINIFNPYDIELSSYDPAVDLHSIKINDEDIRQSGFSLTNDQLLLPYSANTVSFEFCAIDFSDPARTNTKYKMVGIDQDFLESNSIIGFARYPNVPAGQYTFSIIGANSDGVWSNNSKDIRIVVKPPYWQTWWFRLLVLFVSVEIIFWIARSYWQRKLEKKNLLLKQQALIIEKQEAIEKERTRIASEMHDDLGAGLTTIKFLSERALKKTHNLQEKAEIQKISQYSKSIVQSMSEIIWAMNSKNDTMGNFKGYLRKYISEFLEEHDMPYKIQVNAFNDSAAIGGEARRNLFLACKEILHNSVKYSQAKKIQIEIEQNKELKIAILEEEAIGFEFSEVMNKGNGMNNMRQRMQKIGGKIEFRREEKDMIVVLRYPIQETTI